MRRWKSGGAAIVVVVSTSLVISYMGLVSLAVAAGAHPATGVHPPTGVGSCTLKNWNPKRDPRKRQKSSAGQTSTATGVWRVGSDCLGAASAPNSLQFNSASTCDDNPLPSKGFATSPAFDISTAPAPTLTFSTKYHVESYSGHTDQMKVQVKTATGARTTLWSRDSTNPPQTTFTTVSLDLSTYKSTGTRVRFSFDSIDSYPRSHPGWAVDDVLVRTSTAAAPSARTGLTASAGSARLAEPESTVRWVGTSGWIMLP